MGLSRTRIRRHRDELGSITPMIVVLIPAFMLLVGLVNDAGRVVLVREEARARAAECARGGGQLDELREALHVDRDLVEERVRNCPGLPADWTVSGRWDSRHRVIVATVNAPVGGRMLGPLGIGSGTVTETAFAAILVK